MAIRSKPVSTPASPPPVTEEQAIAEVTAALLQALPYMERHLATIMTGSPEHARVLTELAQQAVNAAADLGTHELAFPLMTALAASLCRVSREIAPWRPA
jgi:hypothetical protein